MIEHMYNSNTEYTGKTLTSIAVLNALVSTGQRKGIIVCPASLVDNWEKEIKKWLGVKMKPVCVRSGKLADSSIDLFQVGHTSQTQVRTSNSL